MSEKGHNRTHALQKNGLYSITSSAVARSGGGTVKSSIVAVWAFVTNSNLLDCTTWKPAGGMREAGDAAIADGIGRVGHDNRNRASCTLQCRQGGRHSSDDDIDLQSHELCHNLGKSLVLSFHGAPLKDEILSFDVAQI